MANPNEQLHVIPRDDLVMHDLNEDCACGPEVEDHGEHGVFIHHSLDGREQREITADGKAV